MATLTNEGSYATYTDFNKYSYNCISYLMDINETIWKLLYYDTPDAWNKADLTLAQKASLIYNGTDDASKARVFMDVGQPDVFTKEITIIRISPYSIFPENRSVGTVSIYFEVYSHYKANHLSDYTTRVDTITGEFLKTFNGAFVGGIGRLYFDRLGSQAVRAELGGQIPYRGKWIIMSNKSN
jgi:hypothetical protein